MRQIQRLREAIDENDGEDIRAVFAELKVRHPRKERAERGEKNKPGLDHDTEIVYLRDGEIDHYLTAGSYYGVVDHVARWLHAYGYRAGMGVRAADLALDAYALDCGALPHTIAAAMVERDRRRRIPNPLAEVGQIWHCPKTEKDRRLLRRAERGIFAGFEVWAVQDCVAHAGSPVPWDTDRIFPWVVHVDTLVPCRDDGKPIKVTFSMPAGGPPGSPEWQVAELAAVKRAGIHEAMESFGFDPHDLGDDVAECPVIDGEQQVEGARLGFVWTRRNEQVMTQALIRRVKASQPERLTADDIRRWEGVTRVETYDGKGLVRVLVGCNFPRAYVEHIRGVLRDSTPLGVATEVELEPGKPPVGWSRWQAGGRWSWGMHEGPAEGSEAFEADAIDRCWERFIGIEPGRAPKPAPDPIGMLHDAIDEIAARYKDRGIVGLRVLHRGREIELQVREPAEPPWIAFINPADGDGYATDEDTLEGEGLTVFDALDAVSDKADAAEEDDGRHDEIEPEPDPGEFDQEQDPAALLADVEIDDGEEDEG